MQSIVYSTTTGDQATGWDAFDRMVEWASRRLPGGTVEQIAEILPHGIEFLHIAESLRWRRDAQAIITPTRKAA